MGARVVLVELSVSAVWRVSVEVSVLSKIQFIILQIGGAMVDGITYSVDSFLTRSEVMSSGF